MWTKAPVTSSYSICSQFHGKKDVKFLDCDVFAYKMPTPFQISIFKTGYVAVATTMWNLLISSACWKHKSAVMNLKEHPLLLSHIFHGLFQSLNSLRKNERTHQLNGSLKHIKSSYSSSIFIFFPTKYVIFLSKTIGWVRVHLLDQNSLPSVSLNAQRVDSVLLAASKSGGICKALM